MNSSTNSLTVVSSPSLTSALDTIRWWSTGRISRRQPFECMMATLNFLSCHLGSPTPHQHFNPSWTPYSSKCFTIMLWYFFYDILIYNPTWDFPSRASAFSLLYHAISSIGCQSGKVRVWELWHRLSWLPNFGRRSLGWLREGVRNY